MQVTTVLFDMGGTLFSYAARERIGGAGENALRRLGFELDDPDVQAARRQASEDVEREYATRRAFLHRDMFRDRLARTTELLGVVAPGDVLAQFVVDQRQAIIDHLVPMTDAVATLHGLRAGGLYLGVVSNADDDFLGAVLERHGIDQLVDDWTSSEEADSCKPDHRIYEYSLAKAGRGPSETLFVGDSLQHDVAGAQRAGMRTVLLGEPGTVAPLSRGLPSATADYEIRSLTEMLAIVDGLNDQP